MRFAAEATVRSPTPPSISCALAFSCRSLPLSSQASFSCHQIASPSRVAERPSSTSFANLSHGASSAQETGITPAHSGQYNNFKAAHCDQSVFLALLGTRSGYNIWGPFESAPSSLKPPLDIRSLCDSLECYQTLSATRHRRPHLDPASSQLPQLSQHLRARATNPSRCCSESSSPSGASWRSLHW